MSDDLTKALERARLEAEATKWTGWPVAGDVLDFGDGCTSLVSAAVQRSIGGVAFWQASGDEAPYCEWPVIGPLKHPKLQRVWRAGRIVWSAE